jgi:DNA repair exonuclease SbcCD nuclease subunit
LRDLADWGLLILLEPGDVAAGEPFYLPWQGTRGGYIDLPCGVRVLGSSWYGASAVKAIEQITAAIADLPPSPGATILLFHHGLENQIARYTGALRYTDLLPLKQVGVDYLALGHIHKNYAVEGWIFNPGSVEANNIEESRYDRGVYLVDLDQTGSRAELKRDYHQRSIVHLRVTAQGSETVEEIEQAAIHQVEQAVMQGQLDPTTQPIVELRIEGQVGFDRLELDTRRLQQQLQALSNALILLLKYNAESITYVSPVGEEASRAQVEQEVFMDLLTANNTYKPRALEFAQGLVDLKDLQLDGRSEEELYVFVEGLLEEKTGSL